MKKAIFTLNVHSFVDVITNSSAELFVGNSSTREQLESMIRNVHPNYKTEYESLKSIDELTPEELDIYFGFYCGASTWLTSFKDQCPVPDGFTFDELYEVDEEAWNGHKKYRLKRNKNYSFVTEDNFKEIKNKLDPNKNMYFLFSIDSNPDFEYQERLEYFMDRIHLG